MWKIMPEWLDYRICCFFELIGLNPVIVLKKHTDQDTMVATVCFSKKTAEKMIELNQDELRKYWMTVPKLTF